MTKEKNIRASIRAAIQRKPVIQVLNDIRKTVSASNYLLNVKIFRSVASLEASKLLNLGTHDIKNLLHSPPLNPIPLKSELAWAIAWLKGQSAKINAYRDFANEIQELVLTGAMDSAITKLDSFCVKNGWSLWVFELKFALEQLNNGAEAQKLFAAKLKAEAPNRIVSLIAQVISDRNDPIFSYDAFAWNCLNSFPRFSSTVLPTYLIYRSLSSLYEDEESSLPLILSRELTSNLIDYYEAIIETLFNIANSEADLLYLQPSAIQVIDELLKDGYHDFRLQKLRIALTGTLPSDDYLSSTQASPLMQLIFDACTSNFNWNEIPKDISPFLSDLLKNIHQCTEEGIQAQEAITTLIKLGTNLKSLDIGIAIGSVHQLLARDLTTQTVLPLAISLIIPNWTFNEITASDDKIIESFFKSLAQNNQHSVNNEFAINIFSILNGQPLEKHLPNKDLLCYLWLGRQLILQKRWDETLKLCDSLLEFNSFWHRQSAKLRLSVFTNKGEIENALKLMSEWLLKASHYATEFPISMIFLNQKWAIFSNINPILVGFVSHHGYVATEDHDIHYICKKACSAIATKGGRIYLAEQFENAKDENDKAILIAFMREVWNEVNFAFIGQFESTDDVRDEQM